MTRSTTGAYDAVVTAGGTAVETVATDAVAAESMLLACGAFHAAIDTTAVAMAATPAFLKYPLDMVGNHLCLVRRRPTLLAAVGRITSVKGSAGARQRSSPGRAHCGPRPFLREPTRRL